MVVVILVILAIGTLWIVLAKRRRQILELEQHSITPDALHSLMASNHNLRIVDVRQPLDLLDDSVIIPGAQWFAPEHVRKNPSLLPAGGDLVVYCTCPSDKTSHIVLRRALAKGLSHIKLLKGGLDGWRAKGFPVEPYTKAFRLGTATTDPPAGPRQ